MQNYRNSDALCAFVWWLAPLSLSCEFGELKVKEETKIEFLELKKHILPNSCDKSQLSGKQILRSGDIVFCENGWTVGYVLLL